MRANNSIFGRADFLTIALYVVIVMIGCTSIFSATYADSMEDLLSFSTHHMRQLSWFAFALVVGVCVLLVDVSWIHKFSYVLYVIGVGLLVVTLLVGYEAGGAKAWLQFGSFRIQPVEIVKITTSLAMARVMSDSDFSITTIRGLWRVAMVVLLPLAIIILQNDTGSGIVFCSFLFVLYREGLNKWLCVPVFLVAALFFMSFIISPLVLLVLLIVAAVGFNFAMFGNIKAHLIYLAVLSFGCILLQSISFFWFASPLTTYTSLLVVLFASLPFIVAEAVRKLYSRTLLAVGGFVFSLAFVQMCDFIFTSIMRPHQQNRLMSFLGIVNDSLGIDYNVNQSKIAIGSGGLWGKGFLEGTQIQYGFVPERHTDFIFCAVAEEWGFVGSFILLGCFFALILRLMRMGERQISSFGRVYCYCVASILLFHLFVNIGMTIGLMPVIGIPLPFVSYGGSSLVAFTVLLFVAIRMDSSLEG
ncbi:MAG: rod shape-determining protein RodA [Rikenellaceae bacterium]